MDRLSAVILGLSLALAGCKDKPAGALPSRVEGAKTAKVQGASVESFCDAYTPGADAKPLVWPKLVESPPPPAKTWRWINVWATWCNPCVKEIPELVQWKPKLEAAGHPVDMVFVSVDETADNVTEFRGTHPDTPATLRLADSEAQGAWFDQLGLKGSPPIPIHVFVDPSQHVRCVRSGGVREKDYAVIEQLLGS